MYTKIEQITPENESTKYVTKAAVPSLSMAREQNTSPTLEWSFNKLTGPRDTFSKITDMVPTVLERL